ncbi:unnamed protein product [Lactuca virosa]|uniref:Uncharacterized protein n=1 Tax=Lactuca virosa TaxID=75947 RepID=A0AAU9ND93_9ASTR|nr:unnamed protein product [Lactuca virosa]
MYVNSYNYVNFLEKYTKPNGFLQTHVKYDFGKRGCLKGDLHLRESPILSVKYLHTIFLQNPNPNNNTCPLPLFLNHNSIR